jgi:predicted nucleic acid-binding protein
MEGGLMYLVDTNLVLEVLLRQTKSDQVKQFLERSLAHGLFFTDFSLHSVGVVLLHRNMHEAFLKAVNDLVLSGRMHVLRLGIGDIQKVVEVSQRFHLDFDDAYQYVAADKHDLTLVSFDADFDRTERGRKTPEQVLQELAQ